MERPVQFLNGTETLRGILHEPAADSAGGLVTDHGQLLMGSVAIGPVIPSEVEGSVRSPIRHEIPRQARDDKSACFAVQYRHGATTRERLRGLGVVFLHGWTGCRLGPHRMFVDMARLLAEDGVRSLRFDFRGRGESDGAVASAAIRTMASDACAAAEFLRAETGVTSIVLLGICSGGKVALAASGRIPDADRLVLWSCEPLGGLRTGDIRMRKSASALRIYARKLCRAETWRKLVSGRVNVGKVREAVLTSERPADDELIWESECLERFGSFRGKALFVYGTRDPEAAPVDSRYRDFCKARGIPTRHHAVDGANHSFYSLDWAADVFRATRDWLADDAGRALAP